jgi:hypothetical protein
VKTNSPTANVRIVALSRNSASLETRQPVEKEQGRNEEREEGVRIECDVDPESGSQQRANCYLHQRHGKGQW